MSSGCVIALLRRNITRLIKFASNRLGITRNTLLRGWVKIAAVRG